MDDNHVRETRSEVDYRWSTGGAVGSFFAALRDGGKILASACSDCGIVACPPASYCERCGGESSELREVGPKGVVISVARVPLDVPGVPLEAPFCYILVKLAGADTSLLHVAPEDERVAPGAVVAPEFAKVRQGTITDIRCFVPEGD